MCPAPVAETGAWSVVVEERVAARIASPPPAVRIVARGRSWWRAGESRWAPLRPDAVLDALHAVPRPALVLARPATADPGAACLAPLAALLRHEVVTLPGGEQEAAWAAAIAGSLAGGGRAGVLPAVQVVCRGPQVAPGLPRCGRGAAGLSYPVVRPATLGRWARCAWRPCRWCHGGGAPAGPCPTCGAPLPADGGEGTGS